MTKQKQSVEERRKARRILVQESFSMFVVLPEIHGMARIYMRDVSKFGLCFRSEVDANVQAGQSIMIHLYVNPLFYLPFKARAIRVSGGEIAVEFSDPESRPVKALGHLLDFFESAAEAGQTS